MTSATTHPVRSRRLDARRLVLVLLLLAIAFVIAGLLIPRDASAQYEERHEYREENSIRDIPEFLRLPQYRSDRGYAKKNVHDGNQVAITFFNYGLLGGLGEVRGEWPRGRGEAGYYVGDMLPLVAAEVPVDTNGDGVADGRVNRVTTVRGPRAGPDGPPGQPNVFWGMEAMGGFANDGFRSSTGEQNDSPAISVDTGTWPERWPDEPTWIDPATGRADWNGYFGRGVTNADYESYFWLDDHNDRKLQDGLRFRDYNFRADATDHTRGGMGIGVKVRGMQWSHLLAQDALFMLYEVTNASTTTYPRVAVGAVVGGEVGGPGTGQRDMAFFDQANDIAYSWDYTGLGNDGQPVGYFGFSFLESPGNDFDGIDNDGDSDQLRLDGLPFVSPEMRGQGNTFTSADFQPRVLRPGDPLVLIDPETYARSIVFMPNRDTTVFSQGIRYDLSPGATLQERLITIRGQLEDITVTEKNLIDENLNGLIDEDFNLHYVRRRQNVLGEIVVLPAVRYRNWVGFANDLVTSRNGAGEVLTFRQPTREDSLRHGLLNPMIDEARDDGIDNDGDWDPLTDDVGSDGVPGTGAPGEGDGIPTPGEPNFDATDVNESDQVGLSSFFYFTPPGAVRMNDDVRLWQSMTPGFFTTNAELQAQQAGGGIDGDFIFGSGYFRFDPGAVLRFSVALVFGSDLEQITNNVVSVQEIYDLNYNFARPPDKPTLFAVPGDEQVLLYWNSIAEESIDPVTRQRDFQGYKLYKSTDPNFLDPDVITDGFGNRGQLRPLRQWDIRNNMKGFWMGSADMYQRVRGVPFYLGDDTGIVHSFVDTDVQNGRTYYYALTAYDHGTQDFYPAENNFTVTIREDGAVSTDRNVVRVVPNAPVAGYEPGAMVQQDVEHTAGTATGDVFLEVLNPALLREGEEYSITFRGRGLAADTFVVRTGAGDLIPGERIDRSTSAIFDGMRVRFRNDLNRINRNHTDWADTTRNVFDVFAARASIATLNWQLNGIDVPYDYEIRFADAVVDTSLGGFNVGTGRNAPMAQETPTKFTVWNTTLNRRVPFVFLQGVNRGDPEQVDRTGESIFIYEQVDGELRPTYLVRPRTAGDPSTSRVPFESGRPPQAGDTYRVVTYKSFGVGDTYRFSTRESRVDEADVAAQLADVRAVPNPYVAAASWEAPLPPTITSGRGERRVDFINLPAGAIVRVYTARGELVRELVHDGVIERGTVSWDLRSRENLDIAYGVYFYHVEAPGVGETTGKLAIIK
jgi:hypothetical protein